MQAVEASVKLRDFVTSAALALVTGGLSGSLSALFLWGLDRVNLVRLDHPSLLFCLPAAGILVVSIYRRFGGLAASANLIMLGRLNRHTPPPQAVPIRTIPLILSTSLVSQLFGASTGREGAAVQMGAGCATLLQRLLSVPETRQLELLRCGIAAGFASIFGTPLAGAVFAIEAPRPGSPAFRSFPFALAAAYTGHLTCLAWGGAHAYYHLEFPEMGEVFQFKLLAGIVISSVAFGCAGSLFVKSLQFFHSASRRSGVLWWIPPFLGGLLLAGLGSQSGMADYLGLGVHSAREGSVTLGSAFQAGGASGLSWLHKLFFTALSLGSGFRGGEVTPLFFTGATLGNAIASLVGLPVPLFAGLGFVCVFAGAAHTPLTGAVIALELFGPIAMPIFAPACWIAHKACIKPGIYPAQSL